MDVGLLSLATAVPPHKAAQRDVVAGARSCFATSSRISTGSPPCSSPPGSRSAIRSSPLPGISKRRTGRAAPTPIWKARWRFSSMRRPRRSTRRIFTPAMSIRSSPSPRPASPRRALRRAPWRSWAFAAMSCACRCSALAARAAPPGLALGAELAAARPGSVVLVVTVELCSLAVRRDLATKANMVALALFGDGAAAAVLRSGPGGRIQIVEARHHTWTDTLDIMGWRSITMGFGVIFDQSIPRFAWEQPCAGPSTPFFEAQGLDARPTSRASSVIPAAARCSRRSKASLDLPTQSLDHEREVLKRFGNMSAPTALFVLERVLARGAARKIAAAGARPRLYGFDRDARRAGTEEASVAARGRLGPARRCRPRPS